MILKDIIKKFDKSNIKAGDGLEKGNYPLYTCSPIINKYLNDYLYDDEALIISTGGNFSMHYVNGKFNYSTDCYVFNADKYNLKYMYYYLLSKKDDINKMFRGAGLKHLNKNEFVMLNIKDISQKEQCDIVNQLDKVNEMIELRKKEIEKCNNLIKSQFVEMFGDPVYNEKGWELNKFTELGEFGRGVSKHRPRNAPELLDGPYPLIQTGDVSNSGLYIKNYNSTYSELGLKQSKMWPKGTLCITIAANIAQTGILNFDACFPDSVVGFNPNNRVNSIFIHYWFSFLQKIIDSKATQVAQKNINLQVLSDLDVITPPIELQNKFTDFVNQIDKQKFEFEKSLKKLEELQSSLMQEYFG